MCLYSQRGFTLTELMVALAISAVVVTGMYRTFVQQQRVSMQQEQLTEARQNARLSMDALIEEIRDAGFDPGGLAGAGIVQANSTSLRFTRDLNCNGTLGSTQQPYAKGANDQGLGEDIAYSFNSPRQAIRRQVFEDGAPAGPPAPLASNIIDLNFCYVLKDDLQSDPPKPCTPNPATLIDIRAIQVTLTARATAPDPNYTDADSNSNALFKKYRKAPLTAFVRLRNLGVDRGNPPKIVDFDEICALP
jgi:type IV pilus assembly protein PilW